MLRRVGMSERMANPLGLVILNAVKNQPPHPCVCCQQGCVIANQRASQLILHCVQNDNGEWMRYSLADAYFAALLRNVSYCFSDSGKGSTVSMGCCAWLSE